ncbi:MAG: cytidylate kinase family protein [Bryobacteraceae bacterium]
MAIITVSRGTFSGGKALAECLSKRLGYRCIDHDMLVRKAATRRVSEYDLRAALELPPASFGRLNHTRYVYLALIQAALTDEVGTGCAVYHITDWPDTCYSKERPASFACGSLRRLSTASAWPNNV